MLVYALWAVAAREDIALMLVYALWTERAPSKVDPVDLPSRNKELSFATEREQELASVDGPFASCDLSWILQHAHKAAAHVSVFQSLVYNS